MHSLSLGQVWTLMRWCLELNMMAKQFISYSGVTKPSREPVTLKRFDRERERRGGGGGCVCVCLRILIEFMWSAFVHIPSFSWVFYLSMGIGKYYYVSPSHILLSPHWYSGCLSSSYLNIFIPLQIDFPDHFLYSPTPSWSSRPTHWQPNLTLKAKVTTKTNRFENPCWSTAFRWNQMSCLERRPQGNRIGRVIPRPGHVSVHLIMEQSVLSTSKVSLSFYPMSTQFRIWGWGLLKFIYE